jgi:hypothetical protein
MCFLFSCAFSREGRSYGIMTSRRDTYTTEKRFFVILEKGYVETGVDLKDTLSGILEIQC